MNKPKHTQGPWKVSSDLSIWGTSPNNAKVRLLNMTTHSSSNGIDQNANAQLIAAAPELLEAVVDLVSIIEAVVKHDFKPNADNYALSAAIAAIRKARGEQ